MKSSAAIFVLTLGLGSALTFDYTVGVMLIERDAKIKQLEADVRTASGKYLDLQETVEDQIAAVRSEESVEKWNLQSQLEACQKGRG